jgi:hypothetical protein
VNISESGFRDVHHVATADADDARRQAATCEDVVAQAVDLFSGGFLGGAAEDDLVTCLLRDAGQESLVALEVVVHQEDHEPTPGLTRGGVAVWFEDLAELAEAAPAVAGLGDGLEIAEEVHEDRMFPP